MISLAGRIVLSGLLAAVALSNIAAFLLGQPNETRTRRSIPWLQRSTSLQLAVTAWLFWLMGARGTVLSTYSILIALGMSLSFVADLIMAEIIRAPNRVLGGMLVFGLAHVVYILAYFSAGQALHLLSASALAICIALMSVVSVGLWNRVVRGTEGGPTMNGAALGYTLVIGTMVAVAVAVSSGDGRLWLLPLGGALFMVSDTILGNQIFRRNNWPYVNEVVWLTYIAGQACIVWSNYQALAILSSA